LELGAGAFLFEARLCAGSREAEDDAWLLSDGAWRAFAADAFEDLPRSGIGGMAPESVDARALPVDWQAVAFEDAGWSAAVELSASGMGFQGHHEPPSPPYGALRARPIARLGCERRDPVAIGWATGPRGDLRADPAEQVRADLGAGADWRILPDPAAAIRLSCGPSQVALVHVDFGEVVCGTVLLAVDAPAGARIDVAGTETAPDPTGVAPGEEHASFRYVARGHDDRFETFGPLGFRWLTLSVRADGPVQLAGVAVNERLYPRPRASRDEDGPSFACSDPLLEEVWRVGRRSVDLNSQDAYLDCPTREQRAWTGDFVVHQMVDLTTSTDWRLATWNVELAASPRADGMLPMAAGGDLEFYDTAYIPDWALHWVHALHNLWRYT
ncbi:MAG: alpha-L-rhamnosidase, partial [Deltaproteobacteria bacterium]